MNEDRLLDFFIDCGMASPAFLALLAGAVWSLIKVGEGKHSVLALLGFLLLFGIFSFLRVFFFFAPDWFLSSGSHSDFTTYRWVTRIALLLCAFGEAGAFVLLMLAVFLSRDRGERSFRDPGDQDYRRERD